ncbi:uroporphyrinogen-III C-methyltransferase [Pediococcus claussenii]|uniref:Uroporphyrinogen-III C-methyltransferase n=1 Tax=Pediococcus claussenii (strain ATCC BAA-344 / DSM 14800 / JCM 18046 / KCTC 3811 / LMG 21948 / P06) TaxID=701521 RepID=G8PEK8_PEDCP|nr:uroporphyrinogen-III C-methyltransferase [Pediococcus claussenii]AEV95617.1 uroporphyrin-III C-methyltransferase/uroporphyrinogen-III synthase [Pediococcus claussenii ATCC BAA-344]ANZ69137.1 uroporphyrin-III methyltransferase [Pediococcus claussenii]ANZ70954.1 uroporphyrin-III methyltransferase [Pediococcus claussenii]KRN20150.1 cobA protein [Pediococcus claussenii]
MAKVGKVALVGAGPGDPNLLTGLAQQKIMNADVILFDRLVDPSIVSMANSSAKLIDVGKLPHHHLVKQSQTNQMLVDLAKQGLQVVRLKAGDPFIFGRGGEEAQFLIKNNVSFEVVPGITSALGGLTAVDIPATHRDFSSSVHIISAHLKGDQSNLNWANLAQMEGTLIFLMGMENLPFIVSELVKNGKDKNCPVAIIQWATQWRQKSVFGSLANIEDIVEEQHVASPSIIAIGNVVQLHEELFRIKKMDHQRFIIAAGGNKDLIDELRGQGAGVLTFSDDYQYQADRLNLSMLVKQHRLIFDNHVASDLFIDFVTQQGVDMRRFSESEIVATSQQLAEYLAQKMIAVDRVVPMADIGAEDGSLVAENEVKYGASVKNIIQIGITPRSDDLDYGDADVTMLITNLSSVDNVVSFLRLHWPNEWSKIKIVVESADRASFLREQGFRNVKELSEITIDTVVDRFGGNK